MTAVANTFANLLEGVAEATGASEASRAFDLATTAIRNGMSHPAFHNACTIWFERQGRRPEALVPSSGPRHSHSIFRYRRGVSENGITVPMNNDMPSTNPRLKERVEDVVAALEKDRDEAIRLARMALSDGLVHPLFLNLRAFWLENRGRLTEALADLERAHEIAPNDVPVLNAMGLLFAKLFRPIEAAKAFETVITLDAGFTPAYFNHGWACEMWGELDRARKSYEEAVARSTDTPDSAEPLARLASLAVRRGDWDEASKFASYTLELVPDHPIALLAQARVNIDSGEFETAETELQKILTTPWLSDYDRYNIMGALGDLRHREGRFAEAFRAYQTGNVAWRKIALSRYGDIRTALDAVRWLRRYYENVPASPYRPMPSSASHAACHAFLLGFARSGTTLLEQILASHPNVMAMEERECLGDAGKLFLSDAKSLDRLHALDREERAQYAEAYWRNVREYGFDPRGKVFVDKMPFNAIKLPLIAELFPDAKILFAVRDPRDVLLSCFRHRFNLTTFIHELLIIEDAARFYDAYMAMAERFKEVFPLNVHHIRHEDLVADFEGEVGKACDFLGIAWTDAMRDFAEHRKVRAIATPSAAQIAKGLNREGVGQWRNYRDQMAPALPILAPWVKRFGYPTD